jgi:hypothetical protein
MITLVGYIAQNYGARSATAAGARLKLEAGAEKGHESVELKLISKDVIETEAAKIR